MNPLIISKNFSQWICILIFLGVLEGGKGAITQIVSAHIVRCRIPGPCVASSDALKKNDNDGEADNENSEILKGTWCRTFVYRWQAFDWISDVPFFLM